MIVDPEQGTIDSPLHPDQVEIISSVPEALSQLTRAGYGLAIASNQPAAAKGKTTRENLEKVHARVLELAQRQGGRILSSHICYHRSEDRCACRKPRTGLLEEAFQRHASYTRETSWMVGDGVPDMQAGQPFCLPTAPVAKPKTDTPPNVEAGKLTPPASASDL